MKRIASRAISVLVPLGIALAGAAPAFAQAGSSSAVVLVSGGMTQAPFTTPTAACAQGKPAGSNFTDLRAALLKDGIDVYTAPAMNGPGTAKSTAMLPSFQFKKCPEILPPERTINTTLGLDKTGPQLVSFLNLLSARYGVNRVSLVGWSYGGQIARGAIRILRDTGSPIKVTSLITLGSPWTGMYSSDINMGHEPLSICGNQPTCVATVIGVRLEYSDAPKAGPVGQLTARRMKEWNSQQAGVLDAIPVTAIGGDALKYPKGSSRVWPNDGLVQLSSQLATDVPPSVVPNITRLTFNDVHGPAMSWRWRPFLGKLTSMLQDPKVFAAVGQAVRSGDAR